MLGKLFRNEFKNTWKVMVTIYAVVVAVTIFGCVVMGVEPNLTGKVREVLMSTATITFILSIFALCVVTFLYMCRHFFMTMYSDQGYLTHTLPVKPMSSFNVKLITSLVWLFLSGILLLLSVFSLCASIEGDILFAFRGFSWSRFSEQCIHIWGYSGAATLGILFLAILIFCLNVLLAIFAALSLGQLFNQKKIGAAIGFGIGIYFIQQIVSSILAVNMVNRFVVTAYDTSSAEWFTYTSDRAPANMVWIFLGEYAIFALIEYLINFIIVRKHVNLE